jgi:hypothetical protein
LKILTIVLVNSGGLIAKENSPYQRLKISQVLGRYEYEQEYHENHIRQYLQYAYPANNSSFKHPELFQSI